MSKANQRLKDLKKITKANSEALNSTNIERINESNSLGKPTIFYTLIILINVIFNLVKFPNFIFSGAMWAEMAVNYFPNSKSSEFSSVFLSKDAGYIPFGLRLLSWLYNSFGLSAGVFPYVYSFTAIIGASLLVGFFCLKRFRILIASDLLRFLVSLLVIIAADFETRTYINFTYFGLFFVFINVTIAYRRPISNYVFLTFPILIFSKPVLLSILPVLLFVFFSAKRTLIQKFILLMTFLGALVQFYSVLQSNSAGVFQQDTELQFSDKIKNVFVYYFGSIAIPLNEIFTTSVTIKVIIGIIFFTFSIWIAYKANNQLSYLAYFAILTLFVISIINSVAVSTTFGSSYSLLGGMPLFRYMIPIIDIGILLLVGTIVNCTNIAAHVFSKNSMVVPWKKIEIATVGPILILSMLFSSKNIQEPISPALFNSQWTRLANVIDSDKPVCVPVDPAGWTYGRNCRLLNSDFNWINFAGYDQTLVADSETPLNLDLPRDVNWIELRGLGILVKPYSNENSFSSASLNLKLKNNENVVVESTQRANSSGFLLFFTLPEPIAFSDLASISLQTSNDLILGVNSLSNPIPAVLWYGQ